VRYTISHVFDTDADTFWGRLFFDPAYNEALFAGHLKFNQYRVLELDREPDGSIHRRVECAPPIELPAVAKKIVGDSTSYVEDGRFDPKTKRFAVEVVPRVGADVIKTHVTLRVEPRGDKRIERFADVDNTVKVPIAGRLVEAFIQKQTQLVYDSAAEFTNRWIRDKGL